MLNGIGGRTVAEAKERMSSVEFDAWCQYIRRNGPLDLGQRIESAAALISFVTNQSAGGKLDYETFLPVREIDEEAALEQAMATWR